MTDEQLNDDREDVIIGRALDALDRVSRVDAPLVEAEPEVLEYLEVLSHMPFDEVEPPAALEDRVVEAARAARAPRCRRSFRDGERRRASSPSSPRPRSPPR